MARQLPPLLPPPPPLPSRRLRTPSLLRGSTPRPSPHCPQPPLSYPAGPLSPQHSGGSREDAKQWRRRLRRESRLCQLGARAAAPAVPPRAERLGAGLSPAGARTHKHPHTDILARALTLTDAHTGVREPRLDGGVQDDYLTPDLGTFFSRHYPPAAREARGADGGGLSGVGPDPLRPLLRSLRSRRPALSEVLTEQEGFTAGSALPPWEASPAPRLPRPLLPRPP